jgi:hypothetical protein
VRGLLTFEFLRSSEIYANVYGLGFVRERRWLSSSLTVNVVEEVLVFGHGLRHPGTTGLSFSMVNTVIQRELTGRSFLREGGNVEDNIKGTYTALLVS